MGPLNPQPPPGHLRGGPPPGGPGGGARSVGAAAGHARRCAASSGSHAGAAAIRCTSRVAPAKGPTQRAESHKGSFAGHDHRIRSNRRHWSRCLITRTQFVPRPVGPHGGVGSGAAGEEHHLSKWKAENDLAASDLTALLCKLPPPRSSVTTRSASCRAATRTWTRFRWVKVQTETQENSRRGCGGQGGGGPRARTH